MEAQLKAVHEVARRPQHGDKPGQLIAFELRVQVLRFAAANVTEALSVELERLLYEDMREKQPLKVSVEPLERPSAQLLNDSLCGWERKAGELGIEPVEQLAGEAFAVATGLPMLTFGSPSNMDRVCGFAVVDPETQEALWVAAFVSELFTSARPRRRPPPDASR